MSQILDDFILSHEVFQEVAVRLADFAKIKHGMMSLLPDRKKDLGEFVARETNRPLEY
jgi:hypothetical protein